MGLLQAGVHGVAEEQDQTRKHGRLMHVVLEGRLRDPEHGVGTPSGESEKASWRTY